MSKHGIYQLGGPMNPEHYRKLLADAAYMEKAAKFIAEDYTDNLLKSAAKGDKYPKKRRKNRKS